MSELFIPAISYAVKADIPQILTLLNNAYRGEASTKGWTSETHLISGEIRTDEAALEELINKEGSVFLKYTDEDGLIKGCVNLQKKDQLIYLGMLAVRPMQQGTGTGRQLLHAAEIHAAVNGCNRIEMTVISVRTELIDWYKRNGYVDTGKTVPFPEDERTGKHLTHLEFMLMEKRLD